MEESGAQTDECKYGEMGIAFTASLETSSSLENSAPSPFHSRSVYQRGETLSLLALVGILFSFSSDLSCSHGAKECGSVHGLWCWFINVVVIYSNVLEVESVLRAANSHFMDESDTVIGFGLEHRKHQEQMKSFERVNTDLFQMLISLGVFIFVVLV